jgi:hypothetical protein
MSRLSTKTTKTKSKPIETHRDLCFSLAEAKGTNFIEVPLGSVWLSKEGLGVADVISIDYSYVKFIMNIFECKVTRSDFIQDLKSKKYEKYLPYCNRFYYACLSGITIAEEMPPDVGLMIKGDDGWRTVKAAKKRVVDIPQEALLSMLFFKGRVYNSRRIELSNNYYGVHALQRSQLKGFGKKIQDMILNYNDLELRFRNLLYEYTESLNVSDDERRKIKDEWKNLTYLSKNRR